MIPARVRFATKAVRAPRAVIACVVLIGLVAMAGSALAQGTAAWQTFLRPFSYTQLLVRGDTVWCATGEAGLLLFDRSTRAFSSFTREPGALASNRLTSIALDRTGVLWTGTLASGASRLRVDGTWALVNAFDGLPSEEVTVIETDPARDSVWIGTRGGVALWDGREIAGALPDGVNPSPFASDVITGVVVRADSQFIATEAGVYLRRPAAGASAIAAINSGLTSIVVDDLASDGVTVMARAGGRAHTFDFSGGQWIPTADIGTVHRLSDDGRSIFASTTTGIHRWNGAAWILLDATLTSSGSPSTTFSAAEDASGGLIAANLNGIYSRPAGGGALLLATPNTPPGNNMLNVGVEGPRVYVTTLAEGVGRFDGNQWRNWFPLPAPCTAGCDTTFTNPLFTFALLIGSDGRKWVASWDFGMEVFDDSVNPPAFTRPTWNDGIVSRRHTFASSSVVDLAAGHWFGMDTPDFGNPDLAPIGIDYYDATGAFVKNFQTGFAHAPGMRGNGKVKALEVDRTGRVWVGHAGDGVQYFTPGVPRADSVRFQDASPVESNLDVRGLAAFGDTIWAATTNDLRWYSRSNATLRQSFPVPAGPAQLALQPLAVGLDGRVWFGTTNGIRVYNRDGSTWADFTTTNSPIADDEVRAIRVDRTSGVIWIATAAGLNRFDPFFVPAPEPRLPSLSLKIWPNPSMLSALGVSIAMSGNATTYEGEIYDLSGRMLHRFKAAGNGSVIWDGRDRGGRIVEPGVYFMRARAGGRDAVARIVLLR